MRFLLDVHISLKVKKHLIANGYKCIHANELPNSYYSSDNELKDYAISNKCILITKDADFRNRFLLNNQPPFLIKINLGNIKNSELIPQLNKAISHLENQNINTPWMIEIDQSSLLITLGDE